MKRLIIRVLVILIVAVAVTSCSTSTSIWGSHTCQAQKTTNHR